MKRALFLLLILSCTPQKSSKENEQKAREAKELLDGMKGFRDRVCACPPTDIECKKTIREEFTKWSDAHDQQITSRQFTPEQEDQNSRMMTEMLDCITKVE